MQGGLFNRNVASSNEPPSDEKVYPRLISVTYPFRKAGGSGGGAYHDDQQFEKAFFGSLGREVDGALTPHLFFDPAEHVNFVDYQSVWGGGHNLPIGGHAWAAHARKTADDGQSYKFVSEDAKLISYAISEGILARLPPSFVLMVNGPGDTDTFVEKEGLLIAAASKSVDHNLEALIVMDNNGTFANDCANLAHKMHNVFALAVEGDFMEGGLPLRPTMNAFKSPYVVMSSGGPYENAPRYRHGGTAEDNATRYQAKIPQTYGSGTVFVKTVDMQDDADALNLQYKPTPEFEAFVLSFLARAKLEGLITDAYYDILAHWEMAPRYNARTQTEELVAVCKKGHTLPTTRGGYKFAKGDEIVTILSAKYPEKKHAQILMNAGFKTIDFYRPEGSNRALICAVA